MGGELNPNQGAAMSACLSSIVKRRTPMAESKCQQDWAKLVAFVSQPHLSDTRFLVLKHLFEKATYSAEYDTMCVPQSVIKQAHPDAAKETIAAYEQLCGLALLFNANKDLPGKGEFKKMPIYGRGASSELQDKLCRMDMLQAPDFPQYQGYLRTMAEYHASIAGGLKPPGEDARVNSKQIVDICEAVTAMQTNNISLDVLFTDGQLNPDQSAAMSTCLADIMKRRPLA